MELLQPEILQPALPEEVLELALLTSAGLAAEVVYEGDPTGCPHCAARLVESHLVQSHLEPAA